MPVNYAECGFEIHGCDGEFVLANRRTWWLGYGMGMFAVAAAVLAVVGILDLAGVVDLRSEIPASILVAVGAASGLAAVAMLPTYRRRRTLSLEEIGSAVVIDMKVGVLRTRSGTVVAALDSVSVLERIDWWTRGWMRLVFLAWPGGRRIVFRTPRRERAQDVAESLRGILRAP